MQPVEFWEVLAVTEEFLEAIREMPEALFAETIKIQGREILGSKIILTASSQEEVSVLLPGLLNQSLLQERPQLVLVKRSGHCQQCKPDRGADPDVPISMCPHIRERKMRTVNQVWRIDIERFRAACATVPPPPNS